VAAKCPLNTNVLLQHLKCDFKIVLCQLRKLLMHLKKNLYLKKVHKGLLTFEEFLYFICIVFVFENIYEDKQKTWIELIVEVYRGTK